MSLSDASLIILVLGIGWSMYRLHRDPTNSFNIIDLVMENGRVSRLAFAFLVSLVVTSWVLIRVARDGHLTDAIFAAYGAIWVAPVVAKLFSQPKDKP